MTRLRVFSSAIHALLPMVVAAAATAVPVEAQSTPPGVPSTPGMTLATITSEDARFDVQLVVSGLGVVWGLDFLPDGRALVAERSQGRLSLLDVATGRLTPIEGVPPVAAIGDGGLFDVKVHPKYAENGWIYFSYAAPVEGGNVTAVDRAQLNGTRLVRRERIYAAAPAVNSGDHHGARIVLDSGYLFVSSGDRNTRPHVQDLSTLNGKVIRLFDDGRVPPDNPFVKTPEARPEIWSYGHRNPQGLALNPWTRELWESEHGPMGGDEINMIQPGKNYGWPLITYGREYSGEPVGKGIKVQAGLEQPIYYYLPSIAPSGMEFYNSDTFPSWKGSLFVGSLAFRHLNRLVIRNGRIVHEERLLQNRGWRVRLIRQGPDGFLYVGTDEGLLVRLRPTP